ncbi:MAG: tRNA threonylcarbamoyladenosine dehydratase [Bacteroidales bacterium]|nr:tRNA threonylcarbamoyladenosine dehydratase [Bacteroidales bacterium]
MILDDNDWQSRTKILIGEENIKILQNAHILVAGLGGVGSFAAELLARAGIGKLTLVDSDVFNPSNRNRQIAAFISTEAKYKTDVVENRLKDINPNIQIINKKVYLKDDDIPTILQEYPYTYVLDAIDTLSPKVFLIYYAIKFKLPIISSMGSGGKFDPSKIRITDISDSYECRLAYIVRKKLHRLKVYSGCKVVFSTEKVAKEKVLPLDNVPNKKSVVGTISYMPPIFGAFAVSEIIRDILK